MSAPDDRLTKIEGIAYHFDKHGVATIEQGHDTGNDGDVSRIELHPIFLRLLAEEAGLVGKPSTGLVPDSVVARMCLIGDRLSTLHDDLLADDRQSQPFQTSEPYVLANLILEDLDQLLEEFGLPARGQGRTAPPAADTAPGTTVSLL